MFPSSSLEDSDAPWRAGLSTPTALENCPNVRNTGVKPGPMRGSGRDPAPPRLQDYSDGRALRRPQNLQ
jgi:hypothetical protein